LAVTRFTRQELLDLIWSKPMRSLAADIGLSDIAVRKVAIRAAGFIAEQLALLLRDDRRRVPAFLFVAGRNTGWFNNKLRRGFVWHQQIP
jgi:hypothetical protein